MMCQLAAWFAVVVTIQREYTLVLMRLTNRHVLIDLVDGFHSLQEHLFITMMVWLAGAADAAALASHDFNGMIPVRVTGADFVAKDLRIAQAMGDSDLKRDPVDIDGRNTDTFKTAQLFKVELWQRFARLQFICGTDSRFDNTTSGTKDDSRTSGFTKWIVKFRFRLGV